MEKMMPALSERSSASISLAIFSQAMHFQNREDGASSEGAGGKNYPETLLPAQGCG